MHAENLQNGVVIVGFESCSGQRQYRAGNDYRLLGSSEDLIYSPFSFLAMVKGRGFGGMRSSSMDGTYGRIKPDKDLYSISELHATEVPTSSFGYDRVSKPAISRRSSFSWSRKPSKKHSESEGSGDIATEPQRAAASSFKLPPAEGVHSQEPKKKSRFGFKNFVVGILDSYKKIMQSAEDSNMQFSDLYPNNPMVAPVTPAAGNRGIKYISPSLGVGRPSLVRGEAEMSLER